MILRNLRGMLDKLPKYSYLNKYIINKVEETAKLYGYQSIDTPLLESTEVFARPLGESSDIVGKEMYSFEDRSGNSITLRPELTAGLMRATLQQIPKHNLPVRWYSSGSAFRYERPQSGRFRQFTQITVEHIGTKLNIADIEILYLAWRCLFVLGISEKIIFQINSLGSTKTRYHYREALISYFSPFKSELSLTSQKRLENNPLRILDSKNSDDIKLCQSAPRLENYWDDYDKKFFAEICESLNDANIPWKHNSKLVRGLDYYTHTVFECTSSQLGSQDAVLSGGRYDGLASSLNNKPDANQDYAGVGWALGVERIANLISLVEECSVNLTVIPLSISQVKWTNSFCESLRNTKISCLQLTHLTEKNVPSNKLVGKSLDKAEENGSKWAILIGENEVSSNNWKIRDLKNRINYSCSDIKSLISIIKNS